MHMFRTCIIEITWHWCGAFTALVHIFLVCSCNCNCCQGQGTSTCFSQGAATQNCFCTYFQLFIYVDFNIWPTNVARMVCQFEHRISGAEMNPSQRLSAFSLVVVMTVILICISQIETTGCNCINQMQEHSQIQFLIFFSLSLVGIFQYASEFIMH